MEVYANDEERVEALQRWWKENATSILAGILVGALAIVGWNLWENNRQSVNRQASNLYQQLLLANRENRGEAAIKLTERLIQQYPTTAYGDYARLFLARLKVEAKDLPAARKVLEESLAQLQDDELKRLARLRLAQVLLASGDNEAALRQLDGVSADSLGKFQGVYQELKGDVLVAAGRMEEARAAYEKAQSSGEASPLLKLKMNDLPVKG
ncbi:MAG: YfgM family protein [Methylococcaceae bacterium]